MAPRVEQEPQRIYCIRFKSPLVIGWGSLDVLVMRV